MMRMRQTFSQGAIGLMLLLFPACSTNSPDMAGGYYPPVIADPLEPVNRGVWEFNEVFLETVMRPGAGAYHAVVPEPARDSVGNFRKNIGYPGRLVNQMLQGRWKDMGNETLRFVSNSTVGVGGLFDVATEWQIPASEASFAQTFQSWGWQENMFIVVPFSGPSDDVRVVGSIADSAATPWPYVDYGRLASGFLTFDRTSYLVDRQVLLTRTQPDSYTIGRLVHTYLSRDEMPDFTVDGPIDKSTYQTLGVALVSNDDADFYKKSRIGKVRLSTTKEELPFNLWLQKEPAPIAYVGPGLGSHRLSGVTLKLAEILYQEGFSVVTMSGLFHPEYMESAMTSLYPGDPERDRNDFLVALTEIDRQLARQYPDKLKARALVGVSNGAFQALQLAGSEDSRLSNTMTFDRYLAIHPPVDLEYGYQQLDDYYQILSEWKDEERVARLENTFAKAAVFIHRPDLIGDKYPFSRVESRFLVGFNFRMMLRDTLFSIHKREPLEEFSELSTVWNRSEINRRLMGTSFAEYYENLVKPNAPLGIDNRISLRPLGSSLRKQGRVRAIVNRNDFLLRASDVAWLKGVLGSRAVVFPEGGHLANIGSPEMREAIVAALEDIK